MYKNKGDPGSDFNIPKKRMRIKKTKKYWEK